MKTKQIIIVLLIMLLSIPVVSQITATISKDHPKKFEVTFTVKYNAITLEEAAEKEKEFRKKYTDACSVDITIKEVESGVIMGTWQQPYLQTLELHPDTLVYGSEGGDLYCP